MKKVILILMSFVMLMSFVGCKKEENDKVSIDTAFSDNDTAAIRPAMWIELN